MSIAKASVLEQFETPLKLIDFPLPPSLEPGAALVRTEMAGICGTDVHLWKGQLPIALPVILGHETVGRIEKLGEGLDHDWAGQPLKIGDRVTWNSSTSCGECYCCSVKRQPTRCPQRRAYGIGYRCDQPPHFLGGYAEFHYLRPRSTIFRIPQDLPTESVIGAGCALITAIHGIERICVEHASRDSRNQGEHRSNPLAPPGSEPGKIDSLASERTHMPVLAPAWRDSVVVQGAGPVGIAAVAVAKNAGAERIIVVGGPPHRLEMARRFGAHVTIDIEELKDPASRLTAVRELTGRYGADAVLECVGIPDAVAEGMEMCRDGGKYLILGHYCDAGTVAFNPHVVTRKQLQVFGSWSSEPRHLKMALEFLRAYQREFPFRSMVTHRFSLAGANEALLTTARWQSAKTVIVPQMV